MNHKDVLEKINMIFEDRNSVHDKYCILVNGEWGIGKTYTVNQWIECKKDRYNFRYISVFGKESIRAVENEIILQLLSLFATPQTDDSFGRNLIPFIGKTIGGKVVKQVLSSKLGISLEATEYVKDIAIENINDPQKDNKETIICIDDLERKSDSILIKNLLGLIERISQKFNVIIIANSFQFDEKDQIDFKKYREKVIDYEFKINKIDDMLMGYILSQDVKKLNEEQKSNIISIYKKPFKRGNIKIENQLRNIRVYKKFVALIAKVLKEAESVLKLPDYELEREVIESCKAVICQYYFNDDIGSGLQSASHNVAVGQDNLINIIYKIFKYDCYDVGLFRELLSHNTEVSRDIRQMYKIYVLSHEEAHQLLNKVKTKIEERDLSYFLKQANVISIFDSLDSTGFPISCTDDLVQISNMLYNPKADHKVTTFDSDDWNDVNSWGDIIPCTKSTRDFINRINENNRVKYLQCRNEEFRAAFSSGEIELILKVLNHIFIDKLELFKEVFMLAEKELDSETNDSAWKLMYKLLEKTEHSIALQYLNSKIEDEDDFLNRRRLEHLKDVLEEKEYYLVQMEDMFRESAEEQ